MTVADRDMADNKASYQAIRKEEILHGCHIQASGIHRQSRFSMSDREFKTCIRPYYMPLSGMTSLPILFSDFGRVLIGQVMKEDNKRNYSRKSSLELSYFKIQP